MRDDEDVPNEPSTRQIERAVAALIPFVHEWNLPLNPEHLHELAHAVLVHSGGQTSFSEIEAAVRAQIYEANKHLRSVDEGYRN